MSRRPKRPWKWKGRQNYYVILHGKRHNLGPDLEEAYRQFGELLAQGKSKPRANSQLLAAILDKFLDWCEKHRARDTYEWYRQRIQLFLDSIPREMRNMLVTELKPHHVQEWIDSYPDLANGSRRNYCRAMKGAMSWAAKQGYIERSPIMHMEMPQGGKREVVIAPEEYAAILGCARDEQFRDLVVTAWETGARPQEILAVEGRHVDLEHQRWVFPAAEAKGKKRVRLVYLTDEAFAITKKLLPKYPDGKLFRNTRGKAWTPDAVNCRFSQIEKKLGKKYCLYHFRHTRATRARTKGVDDLTVSRLLGHSDRTMLSQYYDHSDQFPDFYRDAAQRASG